MRKKFEGFPSYVDLGQIDTVNIVQIPGRSDDAVEVVITTIGGSEIKRAFIAADPENIVQRRATYHDAQRCVDHIESYRRRGLLFEKVWPHALTWVASAGFTTWLTGYIGKFWAWVHALIA